MPVAALAGVPFLICLLFSGAMHVVWRRRPQASHARLWSGAFAGIAAGWASNLVTALLVGASPLPGAAASLCWLGAALLFVQGLRNRARRSDRGAVLIAIWAAIAFGVGLLFDLAPLQSPLLRFGAPLLMALGLGLAAVAIGPRLGKARSLDWIAAGLLATFALGNIVLSFPWAATNAVFVMMIAAPLAGSIVYVALGLAAMLLLWEDLAITLERLARTDALTGIWNRRGFDEAAPYLIDRRRRSQADRLAAVAISDIDTFKSVNDRFGHTIGDEVLVEFARLLGKAVRRGDLLARLGGEEFALLAIGMSGAALYDRVEQVRHMISIWNDSSGRLPSITASFGVAEVSPMTLELRDAMERADRALYRAKELGRNRTVLGQAPDLS